MTSKILICYNLKIKYIRNVIGDNWRRRMTEKFKFNHVFFFLLKDEKRKLKSNYITKSVKRRISRICKSIHLL